MPKFGFILMTIIAAAVLATSCATQPHSLFAESAAAGR